jgi:hypothetical protein
MYTCPNSSAKSKRTTYHLLFRKMWAHRKNDTIHLVCLLDIMWRKPPTFVRKKRRVGETASFACSKLTPN